MGKRERKKRMDGGKKGKRTVGKRETDSGKKGNRQWEKGKRTVGKVKWNRQRNNRELGMESENKPVKSEYLISFM